MPIRHDLALETLRFMHGGITQQELSEALQAAKERAAVTGKKATVTLTIDIKPNGRIHDQHTAQYTLAAKVAQRLPPLDRGETIVFGTPDGWQRNDPSQGELQLRDASIPANPVLRDVTA